MAFGLFGDVSAIPVSLVIRFTRPGLEGFEIRGSMIVMQITSDNRVDDETLGFVLL